jgi:hypothetical protein
MRGTGRSVPRTSRREAALARRAVAALALSAAIGGCDGGEGADRAPPSEDGPRAEVAGRPDDARQRLLSVSRTGKRCPGTRPSRTPPFPGEAFNYGNRYLGVAIWSKGRLVASRSGGSTWGQIMPDGTVYAKLGWFRGVPGRLHIQGERLDAPAPPLQASVPAGYGSSGFQATGLTFPTSGCWRVVGTNSGHELELVVFVRKRRAA